MIPQGGGIGWLCFDPAGADALRSARGLFIPGAVLYYSGASFAAAMSNRTYICTGCRTAKRAVASGCVENPMRCSACGGPLWELSQKCEIPRKSDAKGWLALTDAVLREQPIREALHLKHGTSLLKELDRRIGNLEKQKPSEQRDRKLKKLQRDRREVLRRNFKEGYQIPSPT
jgi:hypothetical protein